MLSVAQDIRSASEEFGLPSRNSRAELSAFRVVSAETRHSESFGSLISLAIHISLTAILALVPLLSVHRLNRPEYMTYLAGPSELHPPRTIAARPRQSWKHGFISGNLTVANGLKRAQPTAPVEEVPVLSADSIEQTAFGFPGGVLEGTPGGLGLLPPPSESSDVPLRIGRSVKAPRLLYGPPPEYPRSAREAQVQGDVRIDAVVDKNGNVVEMKILNGPPMLTAAALKAVSQWKYEPTCINGTRYPLEMIVGVSFRLFDSADEAWGYIIA